MIFKDKRPCSTRRRIFRNFSFFWLYFFSCYRRTNHCCRLSLYSLKHRFRLIHSKDVARRDQILFFSSFPPAVTNIAAKLMIFLERRLLFFPRVIRCWHIKGNETWIVCISTVQLTFIIRASAKHNGWNALFLSYAVKDDWFLLQRESANFFCATAK